MEYLKKYLKKYVAKHINNQDLFNKLDESEKDNYIIILKSSGSKAKTAKDTLEYINTHKKQILTPILEEFVIFIKQNSDISHDELNKLTETYLHD